MITYVPFGQYVNYPTAEEIARALIDEIAREKRKQDARAAIAEKEAKIEEKAQQAADELAEWLLSGEENDLS